MASPQVLVIGGPNGAGKSTFAEGVLPATIPIQEFVNADVIAKGLSAHAPERVALSAGRIMLTRLHELAAAKSNFAFETTMASRSFAPFLADLKSSGYKINLTYVFLASPEMAIQRVLIRVLKGGHHIPEDIVRRRYHRSVRNFLQLYLPLADQLRVYDNSAATEPVLIAEKPARRAVRVYHSTQWRMLNEEANREEKNSSDGE